MELSSFATSLGTSFLAFLLLVLLHSWLSSRPGNAVVYFPSRVRRGMDPFAVGDLRRATGAFGWVREAIWASEEEVIKTAGVDAAVYLRFLSTALVVLVLSGIVLLPVLLPVARTDNNLVFTLENNLNSASNVTFNDLDKLAMANIKARSTKLWFFVFGTYWVTIISYIMLWKAYKHISNLRAAAKARPGVRPEDFAILVRDIPPVPKGQTRQEQVDAYFRALYPETFYKAMVISDIQQADKIWEELEGYKKKLARTNAIYAESKTLEEPDGMRPIDRDGFLGIVGSEVDVLNYCNEKIDQLLPKLKAEQVVALMEKQQGAAFVIFNSRTAAATASQTLHAQMIDTWTVVEAPEPREVLWKNLTMSIYERQIRQCVVYGVVFLTVVFYMFPIVFISAFTTLNNLRKILPFMKNVFAKKAVKSVLEAYLPQSALIVFLSVLPRFLKFLSRAEGIPSDSHAVRAASGKYFYFIVFNVFLGVTVVGTLFSSLKTVLKKPGQIVNLLGSNLPQNATFFITFVALKFFVGYGLELARVKPFVMYHMKRMYWCKTEQELEAAWSPRDFKYATRVPNDLLILTIVLCYSVIAPLIILFGVVYFGLGWLILRNQALKVYIPVYESNGRMWPHMHKRIIAALIIYQITMVSYFGIKQFYYAPILIPLPIMSFVFGYICNNRFYLAFVYTPLEVVQQCTKETPDLEAIYRAFRPICLRPLRQSNRVRNDEEKEEEEEKEENYEKRDDCESAQRQVSRSSSFA